MGSGIWVAEKFSGKFFCKKVSKNRVFALAVALGVCYYIVITSEYNINEG